MRAWHRRGHYSATPRSSLGDTYVLMRFCQPRDASEYTANASAMKITKKMGGSRTVIVNLARNMHERAYSKAAGKLA